jgi:hypothetical protein
LELEFFEYLLELKSRYEWTGTASFGIIGHQACNRESKLLQSKITGTQIKFSTNFGGKTEFHPVFALALSDSTTVATSVFTARNCTTTMISLEPCALKCLVSAFRTEI